MPLLFWGRVPQVGEQLSHRCLWHSKGRPCCWVGLHGFSLLGMCWFWGGTLRYTKGPSSQFWWQLGWLSCGCRQSCCWCTWLSLDYFEDILVKIACEFWGAYFREDTEGKADDVIVISVEIDPDPVGGHHEEFWFLMEELGETYLIELIPKYPIRFSISELAVINFRHSICPKLVSWPDMLMNSSLVTFLGRKASSFF